MISPYLAWAQGQRFERPLRQLIACETVIEIPRDVATCPKCDKRLFAHFEAWEQQDDGTWACEAAKLDCESEPTIDSGRKYSEWFRWHYDMPYVYWLPLEIKLTEWINQRYHFDLD